MQKHIEFRDVMFGYDCDELLRPLFFFCLKMKLKGKCTIYVIGITILPKKCPQNTKTRISFISVGGHIIHSGQTFNYIPP